MAENMMKIYMDTTKKQIRALEKGIELLMEAGQSTPPTPAVDTSKYDAAIQQEKDLRVKAESKAEELQRMLDEVKAELLAEKNAHQTTKIELANSAGKLMEKDEEIEDLQDTVKDLRKQLATKHSIPAPSVVKEDKIPAVTNNVPAPSNQSIGTTKDWVHSDKQYRFIVKSIKPCEGCPFLEECKENDRCDGSQFGKGCGLIGVKNTLFTMNNRIFAKISIDNGDYVANLYDNNNVFLGVIDARTENVKILDKLCIRENRGKTVMLQTSPTTSMITNKSNRTSIFTTLIGEIIEVLDETIEEVIDPVSDVSEPQIDNTALEELNDLLNSEVKDEDSNKDSSSNDMGFEFIAFDDDEEEEYTEEEYVNEALAIFGQPTI